MAADRRTLTFLFTDIEGSSRLWEQHPSSMGEAIEQHDFLLRNTIEKNGGHVFKTVGDATYAAFPTAQDAMDAAAESQRRLVEMNWGDIGLLKVRMGLHTGAAEYRNDDYFGPVLNRVSRISSSAHGGQTLLSELTSNLLRDDLPPGITLREIGELHLRNLSRPEYIFQAVIDGLPNDFPPLRASATLPNNLPPQSTRLIGRTEHSRQVQELLRSTRLLTLVGAGGSGKTRLALEASMPLIEEFPAGVWLIELVQVRDQDRIWEEISTAIGALEEMDRPIHDTVLDYLKMKSILLILDNCEQLVNEVSPVCSDILRSCPGVKILATSRQALGLAGERIFQVQPLRTFNTWSRDSSTPLTAVEMGKYEAIQLFVDRAATVQPDFELTNENAADVAEICHRLDGLPLAIELAAARARVLTVHQIAERLENRFKLLRGNNQNLPHQQTLEALMDWSYELLTPAEKALLLRIAIFAGGRTLEAIEEVCTDETVDAFEIVDLLDQLVSKSLVQVELDFEGQPRYLMSESLWGYARAKLEASEESKELRQRHAEYFLKLAELAEPQLEGPNQKRWFDLLVAAQINFRFIFSALDQLDRGTEIGLRLYGALGRFSEVRGNVKYARDLSESLFARTDAEAPELDAIRAKALTAAGRIAWCQDDNSEAEQFYLAAIQLYEKTGDHPMAVLCGALTGFIDRGNNKLELARQRFSACVAVGEQLNIAKFAGIGLSGLGSVALDEGNPDLGRQLKEQSLAIYRKIGDRWISSLILWGVAETAIAQDDLDAARELLRELIENVAILENRWLNPYILGALGRLQFKQGQPALAARLLGGEEYLRLTFALRFTPREEEEYQQLIAELRASLSSRELDDNWSAGRDIHVHELFSAGLRPA